ncbi:MAG: TonB family protein [Bdellovibrionales bacterium]|nr:TonB family protein [Bdellovibrionales bacterium]
MRRRSFIIGSLLVHVAVFFLILYFYYNPIQLSSSVSQNLKIEETQKNISGDLSKTHVLERTTKKIPIESKKEKTRKKPFQRRKKRTSLAENSGSSKKEMVKERADLKESDSKEKEIFLAEGSGSSKKEGVKERADLTGLDSKEKEISLAESSDSSKKEGVKERADLKESDSKEKEIFLAENSISDGESSFLDNKNLSEFEKNKMKDFSEIQQKEGNSVIKYPEFARRKGMEGKVLVYFFVDKNGFVEQIQLKQSSGYRELDNFVIRQLASYQFNNEKETWVRYETTFKLEGEEKEFPRVRENENNL